MASNVSKTPKSAHKGVVLPTTPKSNKPAPETKSISGKKQGLPTLAKGGAASSQLEENFDDSDLDPDYMPSSPTSGANKKMRLVNPSSKTVSHSQAQLRSNKIAKTRPTSDINSSLKNTPPKNQKEAAECEHGTQTDNSNYKSVKNQNATWTTFVYEKETPASGSSSKSKKNGKGNLWYLFKIPV
jgi:hypothetical protein